MPPRKFAACVTALLLVSCAEEPRPPAPTHPPVDGAVDSVSRADIRTVVAKAGQQPIYRIHVRDSNHIEVHYDPPWRIRTQFELFERRKGEWRSLGVEVIVHEKLYTG
jgi:hypothetical protein